MYGSGSPNLKRRIPCHSCRVMHDSTIIKCITTTGSSLLRRQFFSDCSPACRVACHRIWREEILCHDCRVMHNYSITIKCIMRGSGYQHLVRRIFYHCCRAVQNFSPRFFVENDKQITPLPCRWILRFDNGPPSMDQLSRGT